MISFYSCSEIIENCLKSADYNIAFKHQDAAFCGEGEDLSSSLCVRPQMDMFFIGPMTLAKVYDPSASEFGDLAVKYIFRLKDGNKNIQIMSKKARRKMFERILDTAM